ncbi:TIMM22 family protein [Megaselia abdita]
MSMYPKPPGPNEGQVQRSTFFGDGNLDGLAKHFVGNLHRYRENIIIPKSMGPVQIKTNEEKLVESVFESCTFKSVIACVIGYGLGAAIGLFSASVNPNVADPFFAEKRQTAREIFRDMRASTHSYGKNFAIIGAVFSAVECTIETVGFLFVFVFFV